MHRADCDYLQNPIVRAIQRLPHEEQPGEHYLYLGLDDQYYGTVIKSEVSLTSPAING